LGALGNKPTFVLPAPAASNPPTPPH